MENFIQLYLARRSKFRTSNQRTNGLISEETSVIIIFLAFVFQFYATLKFYLPRKNCFKWLAYNIQPNIVMIEKVSFEYGLLANKNPQYLNLA